MCETTDAKQETQTLQINGHLGNDGADLTDWAFSSNESPVQISERTRALGCDVWETFLDKDGRLINESALRKAIFKGGVDFKIRKEVWSFLFGLYPFSSTKREREALAAENKARYQALKTRWKGLVDAYKPPVEPDIPESMPLYLKEFQDCNTDLNQSERDRLLEVAIVEQKASLEGEDQLVFLNFTAKLHADRKPVDVTKLHSSIKVIDKDVPRTDRSQVFFAGKGNHNLLVLRDILITYSAYHQDVGYVQGMNDILSRFLIVFGSEPEAYRCFVNYMETVKDDFLDDGMLDKIKQVRVLLNKLDEQLYNHFETNGMGDMLFVHRWLVLTFKREFSYEDALTMFEIISSQHLELSSVEAERERSRQRAKELERDGGKFHVPVVDMNMKYSFDVFVCLAVLKEYKHELMKCSEVSSVYNTIHSLSMKMDLNIILMRAEELFFKYCRKSVEDCFHVVDYESMS